MHVSIFGCFMINVFCFLSNGPSENKVQRGNIIIYTPVGEAPLCCCVSASSYCQHWRPRNRRTRGKCVWGARPSYTEQQRFPQLYYRGSLINWLLHDRFNAFPDYAELSISGPPVKNVQRSNVVIYTIAGHRGRSLPPPLSLFHRSFWEGETSMDMYVYFFTHQH